MSARYTLKTRKGDTFILTVTYKFEGSIVDLSGYTYEWYVSVGDQTHTYTTSPQVTVPTPANGQIVLTLSSIETDLFTKSNGSTFLRITSGGGVVTTLFTGGIDNANS